MKKIVLLLVLLTVIQPTFALSNVEILNKIEFSLYGYTYSNETDLSRLNRIEEKIYGQKSTGQIPQRIAKLKQDLSADLIGQEIEPKEDTFSSEEDSIVYEKEPAEASKIDYPIINEMEQQVFKKEFKDQNIKTRLSNLETKTFGKTYANEDLSTRVDRLKAQIQPNNFMENKMAQQENNFYNGPVDKMAQNYHLDSYGDPFDYDAYNDGNNFSMPQNVFTKPKQLNISAIEKTLYKTRYDNEPMASRLSRIESSVFGTVFAQDNESVRMERISSAINAQKSSRRYDSNKFSQNMAAAFQIGTLILMVLACIL